MTVWLVHSEWLPLPRTNSADQIVMPYPSQAAAERHALQLACCAGTRYLSVEGPDAVVTFEWDRYTNRARYYGRSYLGRCGNEQEPDGLVCTVPLYAAPGDVQVRCPGCGGWTGVQSPGRRPLPAAWRHDRHGPSGHRG